MTNWKKYGLEDFAEDFEKLGIRTEEDLIRWAPELERRGLTGICRLVGVTPPAKSKPAPAKKKKSLSDRIWHVIDQIFLKLLILIVVLVLILFILIMLAVKMGLLK